jgi:hypothetical protein
MEKTFGGLMKQAQPAQDHMNTLVRDPDHQTQFNMECEADEIMPEAKLSPNDFIIERKDDQVIVGRRGEDECNHETTLKFGETVTLLSRTFIGSVEVTFMPDGSYTAHGPIPEGNAYWIPPHHDASGDNLDAIGNAIKEGFYVVPPQGEICRVDAYHTDQHTYRVTAFDNTMGAILVPTVTARRV